MRRLPHRSGDRCAGRGSRCAHAWPILDVPRADAPPPHPATRRAAATADSGALWTWGGGEHGQLGLGSKVNQLLPMPVTSLESSVVVQVACGWSHSVALTDEGAVFVFGNGDHGKLGASERAEALAVPVGNFVRFAC